MVEIISCELMYSPFSRKFLLGTQDNEDEKPIMVNKSRKILEEGE